MENIGLLIKQKRLDMGMTLDELAKRVGVSTATVSRWETGKIEDMKRSRIKALSDTLEIPIHTIMGWDAPQPDKPPLTQAETKILESFRKATPEQKRLTLYALGLAVIVEKGE